jgi:hypothetical protein
VADAVSSFVEHAALQQPAFLRRNETAAAQPVLEPGTIRVAIRHDVVEIVDATVGDFVFETIEDERADAAALSGRVDGEQDLGIAHEWSIQP